MWFYLKLSDQIQTMLRIEVETPSDWVIEQVCVLSVFVFEIELHTGNSTDRIFDQCSVM